MEPEVGRQSVSDGPIKPDYQQQQMQPELNKEPTVQSNNDGLVEQTKHDSQHDLAKQHDDQGYEVIGDKQTRDDGEKQVLFVKETNEDKLDDDGFVIIDPDNSHRFEKYKASFFAQMEKYLLDQVALCTYYKKLYEDQKNGTLANLFETHLSNSVRDLDLLRIAMRSNDSLPKYKLEVLNFNGVPINIDVKDKELQLIIRATKLPVPRNTQIYVIGEFSFSLSDQPMSYIISRWLEHVKVDPRNLVCCSVDTSRQMKIIKSTDRKPFTNPASEWLEFDKPMVFAVSKGKSRTHKRKFKPIKLTFFERTNLLNCGKKIGTVQLNIDAINDEARVSTKQIIMNGRKDTGAFADIQIKVRNPLVENTIRANEEKLLILS